MKVAVCDDMQENTKLLKDYLNKYALDHLMQLDADIFYSGQDLIQASLKDYDLFLMDVEMPNMNGIETARVIRQQNQKGEIIFITNYIQYAIEGYEVQAFRYLLKPVSYKQFEETVGHALNKIKQAKQAYIHVKERSESLRIKIQEIVYAETYKGHVLIHTYNQCIECFNTMEKLEAELAPHNFYRCHHAFIVALNEIVKVQLNDVVLDNGTVIPVSKNRKKEFKQVLTNFWGGRFL